MQLTVDINIEQLIQILRSLPANQREKIKSELNKSAIQDKNRNSFQEFLLKGPTMTDSQYEEFLENRKKMNQWRTK
jgi:hypothetical protein